MSAPALKFKPIALAVAFAFPTFAFAAAGRIDFAVGDVKALAPDGRTRPLGKGDEFDSGDTIETGNGGRAWLRFTDGAQVSLQPQSQYRIDNYRFNGQADGEERGFFNLVKGGLRTITGWVGRTNRKNYQVTTAVATIGIRGTEFSIVYGNSITVSTGEGAVEICNSAGCLTLTSGESGYVADQNTMPVLVTAKADLPPPPAEPEPTFSVADTTASNGNVSILGLPSGGGYSMVGVASPGNMLSATGTAAFSGSSLDSIGGAANTGAATGVSDGIIGWGRWTTAISGVQSLSDVHYVVGMPTAAAEINTLSGTYNFTLLGATTPSTTGTSVGTVSSGSLQAIFSPTTPGDSTLTLSLTFSGFAATVSGTGSGTGSSLSGSLTCPSGPCGGASGGTGTFTGLFVGSNAARAGISYQINTFAAPGTVWGTAAFTR